MRCTANPERGGGTAVASAPLARWRPGKAALCAWLTGGLGAGASVPAGPSAPQPCFLIPEPATAAARYLRPAPESWL